MNAMIITIDGLSFQGKSYICEHLANKVGFKFFSTGTLVRYIAVQYNMLFQGEDEEDTLSKAVSIMQETSVDDIMCCKELKSSDTERTLQIVASYPFAFDSVVDRIKTYNKETNIIMDGRFTYDIFPNATLSFYLVSSFERRVKLVSKAKGISVEEAVKYIVFRDSIEKKYTIPSRVKTIILDDFQGTDEVINYLEREIRNL